MAFSIKPKDIHIMRSTEVLYRVNSLLQDLNGELLKYTLNHDHRKIDDPECHYVLQLINDKLHELQKERGSL